MARDTIYTQDHGDLDAFAFDDAVARVFPDMIKRSVPGYTTIIPMLGVIAGRYGQENSNIYDLGCSLGSSLLAMRHGVQVKGCKLIGIDNAKAMIARCKDYVAQDPSPVEVELYEGDIIQFKYEQASVITLNFTLQFIAKELRDELIQRLYDALLPGGALVLSEKVCFEQPEQALQEELHWDFKRANGYSELEISQKRSALENVLTPESTTENINRLCNAGFSQVNQWYQCFNFTSFIAVK